MILDNIHNHYENLVYEELLRQQAKGEQVLPENVLEDVVCVALNNLPARYVRHSVDTAFYLTLPERQAMAERVNNAVSEAIAFVSKNPHED
ncbi:MAG: late competence development ComFB family protein [Gammaproteobacteria bacterium]|nr:late competence development ComFB family protein [Gammaproteobacteria bacterium]